MDKKLKISVGICVKKPSEKLSKLINEIPTGCCIYIVSGERSNEKIQSKSHEIDYTVIEDSKHGYDLVRNRKSIFDKFNESTANLLLFLDDDEHFPLNHPDFFNFLNSSQDVGMLAHQNMYNGRTVRCTGKNYHARLLKKGEFPLEGKVIERVGGRFTKLKLQTRIKHDFLSSGMEDFVWRANRWAKENASGRDAHGMRPWVQNIRKKIDVLAPFARFFYHYAIKGGFLDGRVGFYVSCNYALSEYLAILYKYEKTAQSEGKIK